MIKKIKDYYKRKKRVIELFSNSKEHLEEGIYSFDETLNYISLKEISISRRASQMFGNGFLILSDKKNHVLIKKIINYFIKTLNVSKFKVSDRPTRINFFNGQIFLPAGNGKGYKVFDIRLNRVLLCFESPAEYLEKKEMHSYFKNHFLIPQIISQNDSEKVVVEELINYKSHDKWIESDYEMVMNDIFKRYNSYLSFAQNKNIYLTLLVRDILGAFSENKVITYIKNRINKKLLNENLPILKLHGDLWTSNILIRNDDNSIYYIDWESSNNLILYYDIFVMMWTEVYNLNNYYYVEKYILGHYDFELRSMFEIFDIKFNEDYRLDYIGIFFAFYYKERWNESEEEHLIQLLENFYENLLYITNKSKDGKNESEF